MRNKTTITAAMLALVLMLSAAGCGTKGPATGSNPPGTGANTGILDTLTDQQLVSRYIEGLDIALIGDTELVFTDAGTIPSQTLTCSSYMRRCRTSSTAPRPG